MSMTPEERYREIDEWVCRENPIKVEVMNRFWEALKAQDRDSREENRILRKLLWLRHGCPGNALYGDDGQMQCNKCMIDFKHTPAEDIEAAFHGEGLNALLALYGKSLNQKGGEDGS